MRKHGLAVFVALSLLPGSVAQALPVNPLTGGWGLGSFAGWGSLVAFSGAPDDTSLDITPGFASLYDVYVSDMYIVGDAFGLIVDSVPMDWRASSWIGSGGGEGRLFDAYYWDLLLDAGPHQIQFVVTSSPFGSGQMYWEVSRVPGPVPEPASLLLFGTGLVALRAWRKRRQYSASGSVSTAGGHQRGGLRRVRLSPQAAFPTITSKEKAEPQGKIPTGTPRKTVISAE